MEIFYYILGTLAVLIVGTGLTIRYLIKKLIEDDDLP